MAKSALAVVADRCERCDCGDSRREFLRDAVIEAARGFMAAHLADERRFGRGCFASQTIPTSEVVDALQTLRDALAAERRARRHGAPA